MIYSHERWKEHKATTAGHSDRNFRASLKTGESDGEKIEKRDEEIEGQKKPNKNNYEIFRFNAAQEEKTTAAENKS